MVIWQRVAAAGSGRAGLSGGLSYVFKEEQGDHGEGVGGRGARAGVKPVGRVWEGGESQG